MSFANPDWRDLAESGFDPEKPIRSEQGIALYENVLAAAAGKTGAPRVQGIALGGVSMGAISLSALTSVAGYTNCDRMGLLVANFVGSISSDSSGVIKVAFSSDNGTSYGAWQTLFQPSGAQSGSATGSLRLNLETGDWYFGLLSQLDTGTACLPHAHSGTVTPTTDCNAFIITGLAGSLDFFCLGGIEA